MTLESPAAASSFPAGENETARTGLRSPVELFNKIIRKSEEFSQPGKEWSRRPVSLLKRYTPPFSCPDAVNLPSDDYRRSQLGEEKTQKRCKPARSIDIPKFPLVSNSRIFAQFAKLSQTLTRPSTEVLARYWPSSDRAIAHISPALLPSEVRSESFKHQYQVRSGLHLGPYFLQSISHFLSTRRWPPHKSQH